MIFANDPSVAVWPLALATTAVADALKRFHGCLLESALYVVNAVIGDDGRGGRFALDDSSRISGYFFGGKSGTRRDRRMNLKAHGRSRNRVFEELLSTR